MSEAEQLEELVEEEAAAAPVDEEFKFHTLPPEISFQTERVPPPTWLYVGPDDRLWVVAWNAMPAAFVTVYVRLLLPNGKISLNRYEVPLTDDRARNEFYIPLVESFLLSVSVTPGTLMPLGSCWVRILLMSGGGGGTSYPQGIVMGYMVKGSILTWPYPRFQNPVEGPGRLRLIEGTDPAAGVSIAETVPVGARWKLVSVFAWLATDATVFDRHVYLVLMSPAGVWLWLPPAVAQPASQTYYYTWGIGLAPYTSSLVGLVARALPDQLTLTPGQQFMVQCGGMQVGDDFGPPRYLVEEWVEP